MKLLNVFITIPVNMSIYSSQINESSVLVTGGAGFIGSHIVQRLVTEGAKRVVILDNLSNGFIKNIEGLLSMPQVTFIEGDIRNLSVCMDAAKGVDLICHQAALGSVPRSLADPVTTNEVNIGGFLNMMLSAKENDVKRFVYAASSSTYGDSTQLPKREDLIGKPMSPYAVTKYVNELYAHVFGLNFGMKHIGLRYFNVFGPGQDPKGAYAAVIPLFIQAVLDNESPLINGDGEQTRDFTYIDNVVEANMHALFTANEAALNTVYNIAYGQQTSINQLVSAILNQEKKEIKPVYRDSRSGDVRNSLADISRARTLLGYNPQIDFEQGIAHTYSWFKNNQEFIRR